MLSDPLGFFLDEDSLTLDVNLEWEDAKPCNLPQQSQLIEKPRCSIVPLTITNTTTTTETIATTEDDLDSQSIVLLSSNPRKRDYDSTFQSQTKQRKRKKLTKKSLVVDENNCILAKEKTRYHEFVASFNSSCKDIIEKYNLLPIRGKKPIINQITVQSFLGSELDIQVLSNLIVNSSVSSQILQMKDSINGATIKVTKSGCVKVFGLKRIQDCAYSMHKACSKIQEQHNVYFSEIHPNHRRNTQDFIQNVSQMAIVQITASLSVGFPIKLSQMEQDLDNEIQKDIVCLRHDKLDYSFYDSEIKNYLSYYYFVDRKIDPEPEQVQPNFHSNSNKPKKILKNYVSIQIYASGKISLLGVKFVEEINLCFRFISDLCKNFVVESWK